jgi:hypothetical protein
MSVWELPELEVRALKQPKREAGGHFVSNAICLSPKPRKPHRNWAPEIMQGQPISSQRQERLTCPAIQMPPMQEQTGQASNRLWDVSSERVNR